MFNILNETIHHQIVDHLHKIDCADMFLLVLFLHGDFMVTDHINMTAEKENSSLNVISSTAMETVSEDKLQVLKGKSTHLCQLRALHEANNASMLI